MNVLIVDDLPDVVRSMEQGIDWRALGVDSVFTAFGVPQAQRVLCEKSVQILLCDVEMPPSNGFELLKWCREQGMDIQCVFLSAYADFAYAQTAVKLGSFDYILQPAPLSDVEKTVRRVISRIDRDNSEREAARLGRFMREKENVLLDACVSAWLRDDNMPDAEFISTLNGLGVDIKPEQMVTPELDSGAADAIFSAAVPGDARRLYVAPDRRDGSAVSALMLRDRVRCLLEGVSESPSPVALAEQYIRENIEREFHRDEVAGAAFVSADHLTRLFKKEKGMSLAEYVLREKMATAERLLFATGVPVSMVAGKVGFSNFSYFSQVFKKYTGYSPSEYRAHKQGQ